MTSSLTNILQSRSSIRDYEILETISESPLVSVQKCRSKKFKSIVALKRIKSATTSLNSSWIADTVTDILRNRYHHNIVNLLDYFVDGRDFCLVLEYFPGSKSLRNLATDYARNRADCLPILSSAEIILLAIELIDVLCYLHSHESSGSVLFHGELKPENILISRDRVKDISEYEKVITSSAKFKLLTIPSSLVSYDNSVTKYSPKDINYSAPEILLSTELSRPSRISTSKSDMWSLAATLLNLSTSYSLSQNDPQVMGRFQDNSWSFEMDVLANFTDSQQAIWDQQPVWLQDIICSCLQLNPETRFTAHQLREMPSFQAAACLYSVAKEDVHFLISENKRLIQLLESGGANTTTIKSEDSGKYESLSNVKMLQTNKPQSQDKMSDNDSTKSNCSSDDEENVQTIFSNKQKNSSGLHLMIDTSNKTPSFHIQGAPPKRQPNTSTYDNEVRHIAERSLASQSMDVPHSNSNYPEIVLARSDTSGGLSDMEIVRNLKHSSSMRGCSFGSVLSIASGCMSLPGSDSSFNNVSNLHGNSANVDMISLKDVREGFNIPPVTTSHAPLNRNDSVIAAALEGSETHKNEEMCVKKQVLQGHSHYIACLAVLPNDRIASGSYDHTIKIWNPASLQCEKTLYGHSSYVYCLTVLPDGRLISGSWDTTLKVWNVETGECEQTLSGHSSFVCWIVYLADTKRIVSGDYKKSVRVWQSEDNGKTFQYNRTATLPFSQCVTMLPNGSAVLFQGTTMASTSPTVNSSSESADSTALFSAVPANRSPRLGDAPNSSSSAPQQQVSPRLPFSASKSNSSSNSSSNYAINANLSSPPLAPSAAGPGNVISPPAVIPSATAPTPTYSRMRSESLLTSNMAGNAGNGNSMGKTQQLVHSYKLCYPYSTQMKCAFEGHTRPISAAIPLAASGTDGSNENKNNNFVTVSGDRTARVWDGDTGACLAILAGHTSDVNAVSRSSNGYIVTSSNDHTLRVWDTSRYADAKKPFRYSFRHNVSLTADFVLQGHQHFVSCVAVLSDGRIVSGSFDKTLIVWSGMETVLTRVKENVFLDSFCLTASEDEIHQILHKDGIPVADTSYANLLNTVLAQNGKYISFDI